MSKKRVPWNKGLTKENNESMKKISDSRKGKNNPIHKVLDDPEKKEKWKKACSDGSIGTNKGSLVDRFGEEKAKKIKEKQSQSAKQRKVHGHTGHKHSKESLNRALKKRMKTWKEKGINTCSKEQIDFFENLKKRGYNVELDSPIDFYRVDILFEDKKIVVEVDGDWWHCNKDSYKVKEYIARHGDISETQKRNLANDVRKNSFLKNKGYEVIRVWVSDIENNIEEVIKKIEKVYNEKQII